MKISIILGTRPEIVKFSPIIRECLTQNKDFFILHTGQHYSFNMDNVFFNQLNLPPVKYNLNVGSGTHGQQTAKMLMGIEKILVKEKPDVVLIQGDTNSVLAGALAATKLNLKVGHIESGLRSYFWEMPEEKNRILADHVSDFLFAPTEKSRQILLNEGISKEKIFVTGNTVVDAVRQNLKLCSKQLPLNQLNLLPKKFILATIHRQENVDDKKRFRQIIYGLNEVSNVFDIPVIYPVHPRAKKQLKQFKLNFSKFLLLEPLDYLCFLSLESMAELILTDSGGVQEEACILRVPCVTLRDNTERPETLEVKSNILAGVKPESILSCSKEMFSRSKDWVNPFGDGYASKNILRILDHYL